MTEKKSTKFAKGVSGNPAGRPPNAKGKALTDKQVMNYLGKRTEDYLKKIEELANAKDTPDQLKFKCLNGLLNFDFQLRASEYKKWLDKEKLKGEGGSKGNESGADNDAYTPVISLTSVKK